MHRRYSAPLPGAVVFWTLLASATIARAQTLTWGVNGVGGSGNWDTTTADWFNGSQNVAWASGGNAIFAGASGGTVSSFSPGPVVTSMTFNTPGYVIQGGQIESSTSGLIVTANVDATISSTLNRSVTAGNSLTKNGPAALIQNGTNFLGTVQVNQGELRIIGSSNLGFSTVVLADAPGVVITFAPTGSLTFAGLLSGGGTMGGVIRPDDQPRTVTLESTSTTTSTSGVVFGGVLEDNGSGVLAMAFNSGLATQALTNVNTYSGPTTVGGGTLIFSGNGTALNSSSFSISRSATLSLDDSSTVVADRLSDTSPISVESGAIQLKGNNSVPIEEKSGRLTITGIPTVTVTQPGNAATQLTFAGLQRNGHATLTVSGPGVEFVGISNGASGIALPFITFGNNWATVGADGRLAPLTSYASDINSGATTDNVKLTAGTTALAAVTTRGSLYLQNNNTTAGQTLDLSGQNLELTSGGILSNGLGASTVQNGNLSTASQEMVVTANNNLTIQSAVVDSNGSTALTKTGPGTLTLSGANTYTGSTAIMQGTLVVSSDSNLGLGSTIDLSGGTLKAAGNFSSAKGITKTTVSIGGINTAGFNVAFSGPVTDLNKSGLGTLTLASPVVGNMSVAAGTLALPNVTSGAVVILGGTLQASGTLTLLADSSSNINPTPVLDLGGPAAAQLTTTTFRPSPNSPLSVDFGLGSGARDLWIISSGGLGPFSLNPSSLQFEFRNLGGVTTGVDYPLISYSNSAFAQPLNAFAFAPDMAAAGWSGTFTSTSSGVSVRFTSVPEPSVTALMLLQGALMIWAARRRLQKRIRRVDAAR